MPRHRANEYARLVLYFDFNRRPHIRFGGTESDAEAHRFCELSRHAPVPEETIILLQSLNTYRLGLVTTASRSIVEPALASRRIVELFAAVVCGEGVETSRLPMYTP
jgi:phosphoglycolate phosphatase-like HAD superfamily hydrolase